jgi:ribosomal protein S18 acetylase RimI-like enzyme
MYEDKFRDEFIGMFSNIFPDSYIPAESVIESIGKERDVFCVLDESGAFVGYGVLKRYADSSHATAEIFGVDEKKRGRGYGWAVLNAVLDCALNKYNADTVDLVVDKLNVHARELYYSCGFKLTVENAAYCYLPNTLRY